MRLEKLELTNITSLKGAHKIDFPRDLAGEDLFAITGPTGSGKSSLLVAMTLALYGRGAKTELSGADFISQGMREGEVRLSFSTQGKTYLALWSCTVLNKKGAALAQPRTKRELYLADREGQWHPLDQSPEEVIGLNFDQFSKTVVLNQGEFAKFLTSSFSERRQILEKLYQGEALSGLKSTLNQICKNQTEQIEQLELKKESLLPFTQQEYDGEKKKIQQLHLNLERHENLFKKLRLLDSDLQRLRELSQSLKRNADKKKNHEEQYQQINLKKVEKKNQQIKQELQYQESALKLKNQRPLFQNAIDCQKNEKQIKSLIVKYHQDEIKIKDLIAQKSQDLDALRKLIEQEKLQAIEYDKLIPSSWRTLSLEERSSLSGTLQNKLQEIYPLEAKHHQTLARVEQAQAELEEDKRRGLFRKEELEKVTKEKAHLDQQMLTQFQGIQWTKTVEQCLLNKQQIENQINQFDHYTINSKKLNDEIEQLVVQQAAIEKDLLTVQHQWQLEEKNAQIHQLQIHIQRIRVANQESDHCLVCGQEHRSDAENVEVSPQYDLSVLEVAKQNLELKNQDKQNNKNQLELKMSQLEQLKKQWSENLSQLRKIYQFLDCEPESLDLKALLVRCEEKLSLAQKNAALQESMTLEQQKLVHQSSWLEKELVVLRNDFNQKQAQLKADITLLENLVGQLTKIKSSLPDIESDTQALQTQKNHLDQAIEISKRLNKDLDHARNLEKEVQKFQSEQSMLRPEIERHNTLLAQNQTQLMEYLTILQLDVHQTENLEERLDELEKNKDQLLKDKEKVDYEVQQLTQDENYHRTLISSLEEQKQEITLTSEIHKRRICETIDSEEAIAQEQKNLRWFQKIENLSFDEFNEESNIAFENLIMDQFTPFFDKTNTELKEQQAELSELQARVVLYEKQKQAGEEITAKLSQLKVDHLRYKNLQFLIGKDEFRNFALSIIENELVAHTNKELERICDGRYQIDLRKTTRGQDYLITDFWQGGAERKVSTLSGGETFLVSLAMALSLAEMCRGETQIDSFFIDEGFGTLDQDSLDEVIETLFTVRSRGKQIGIISHVKELTSRIAVNIDIMKDSHGQGQIQILYN